MASTFLTGEGDNDLALDALGRLMLETDPVIAAAIKLKHRFQFFKGEWWLDTRLGVPYFTLVFGQKNPNLPIIRRLIRRIIVSCPPITDVKRLDLFYVPSDRLLAFEFEAVAEDGRIVSGGPGLPYLVSEN
jgi:hypothetical protein